MKGKADLSVVSRLATLFRGIIPIISNGNIITRDDVQTAANEGTLLVQLFLLYFLLFFCFASFFFSCLLSAFSSFSLEEKVLSHFIHIFFSLSFLLSLSFG